MTAEEILKSKKTYAIVGASNDKARYGYELVKVMHNAGFEIYPVNPKCNEIHGIKCYPSLKEIPTQAEVVIIALAPHNTLKAIEDAVKTGIKLIWMPPECWSEETVDKCKALNLDYVYDVCPVGLIKFNKHR